MEPPRWLSVAEQATWISLFNIAVRLESMIDNQLRRDASMTMFEYYVLVMLSEEIDRTLTMGELAARLNSSPSRLSHVVNRLESRNWVTRRQSSTDRRGTYASLTDAGFAALTAAAPGHVAYVRQLIFDVLEEHDLEAMQPGLTKIADSLTPVVGRSIPPALRTDDRVAKPPRHAAS